MFVECYLNTNIELNYYLCAIHVAEEAAHTGEFVERMDQLFNAF